ncbi:MAG: hypothetical protein ACYTGQ_04935 [Planctomycetota bacterium]|jgi:hypothetical protein
MTDLPLKFGDLTLTVPPWWFDALLLLMATVGLLLWLFGKRLVKPTFSVMGLGVGLFVTTLALRINFPDVAPIPWLIAGGVIGLLVGLLMWRFGMAVVFMFAVAITAPVVVMTFQGIEGPEIVEPFVYQFGEAKQIVLDSVAQHAAEPENTEGEKPKIDTSQLLSLTEPLKLAQTEAWENFRLWWDLLEPNQNWLLTLCSLGGGLLAFIFGIALPGVAASLVTALMGAVLIMAGVMRLSDGLLPDVIVNLLPHEPRSIMLALGVAMVIGALLQWTFFRKPADKSD